MRDRQFEVVGQAVDPGLGDADSSIMRRVEMGQKATETQRCRSRDRPDLALSDDAFQKEATKFFEAQREWRPALQKVRAGEFKC